MTDWKKLAEPFDASDIKERPGRGDLTFSYVDARAVMQRLDDVLTPEGWDFQSTVIPGTDVVHGKLVIGGNIREDYGYPNSDRDEEPIKAASSDALKRCAVMFGIGRHLYDDNKANHAPRQSSGRATQSSPTGNPPARPPARSSTDLPSDLEEPEALRETFGGQAQAFDVEGTCPDHELPWTLRPGGVSKTTGKPYDAFWACPSSERPYCKNKPSPAWQRQQAAA